MKCCKVVSLLDPQLRRTLGSLLVVLALIFGCGVAVVFAAAGDLDSSFDGDGMRILSGFDNDRGQAVAIQKNDGKIVVAGYTDLFGSKDILVMRFNPDGSLDTTFNNGGVFVLRRNGTEEFGRAVAIQSNGKPGSKIVVVGDTNTFRTKNVFVLRLNLDGSVDSNFASAGIQTVRRTGNEQAEAVAVRGDDRLVIAGTTDVLGNNDVFVLQLNANGSLDGTFINGGVFIVDRASDDHDHGVALRTDGRIVVAGSTNVFGTTDFFVVQLNANGGLDQSFFPTFTGRSLRGGVRTIEQTGEDQAQAVTIQSDGKIVLAGSSTLFGLNDFMLVRLNPNGSLDTTFDSDGKRLVGPFGESRAQALAIQADQKIVVAGHTDTLDVSDVEVMRFLGQ